MAEQDTRSWWVKDVARVMEETDTFYTRLVEKAPHKTKLALTQEKIIAARGWAPTLSMYEKNFEHVLKQLGFFYVPNRIIPGPAFVFPVKDVYGKYSCAQTKPLEGSVLFGNSKYRFIQESKPVGPRFLGNDYATMKKVIELRKAFFVEGPFDLLAVRLLCPDIPSLSPLTKRLGMAHRAYLRMLGVQELILMYDNEEAKAGKVGATDGAGNMSMEQQAAAIKEMKVTITKCPLLDPSECLKSPIYAKKLKSRILTEF